MLLRCSIIVAVLSACLAICWPLESSPADDLAQAEPQTTSLFTNTTHLNWSNCMSKKCSSPSLAITTSCEQALSKQRDLCANTHSASCFESICGDLPHHLSSPDMARTGDSSEEEKLFPPPYYIAKKMETEWKKCLDRKCEWDAACRKTLRAKKMEVCPAMRKQRLDCLRWICRDVDADVYGRHSNSEFEDADVKKTWDGLVEKHCPQTDNEGCSNRLLEMRNRACGSRMLVDADCVRAVEDAVTAENQGDVREVPLADPEDHGINPNGHDRGVGSGGENRESFWM